MWTEKKISWYERAIDASPFLNDLTDTLIPFLNRGETIGELGCGTGDLSLELTRRGYDVTAVDIDQMAVEHVLRQSKIASTPVKVYHGDWASAIDRYKWDTVIMCFAGNIRSEIDLFMRGCRRQLLYVTQEPCQEHICFRSSSGEPSEYRLYEAQMQELLEQKGLVYKLINAELELGQPFHDEREAVDYMILYGKPEEQIEHALKCLVKRENKQYPLYLPKKKNVKIYQILK